MSVSINCFSWQLIWNGCQNRKAFENFAYKLIDDYLIVRDYTRDRCVHGTMLRMHDQVKVEHVTDIPYSHNLYLKPHENVIISFDAVNTLNKKTEKLM
ncbi:unnamed protein product [Rotaria magnacalcarata]|uniref:Uncharacterized protein n=1 Tax=Rotaria magnacalcarata TaxID=392030 RepID=A0A8S3HMA8_9BILA|nr:unnamed protein product [Rotaria magnacalcarata]